MRSENYAEETARIKSLKIAKRRFATRVDKAHVKRLIKKLTRIFDERILYPTLASKFYSEHVKRREVSILTEELRSYDDDQVRFFHAVLAKWAFPADEIPTFDPAKFLERIRYHLRLCGVEDAKGFMLLRVHGELEPNSGIFWPHVHGVATGGMVKVLVRLREYYKDNDISGGPKKPMLIRKVGDRAAQISYIFQTFWPCRYRGPAADDPSREIRQRRKQRMPEPIHALWLCWADAQMPSHLVLLMGNRRASVRLRRNYRTLHKINFMKGDHSPPGV